MATGVQAWLKGQDVTYIACAECLRRNKYSTNVSLLNAHGIMQLTKDEWITKLVDARKSRTSHVPSYSEDTTKC